MNTGAYGGDTPAGSTTDSSEEQQEDSSTESSPLSECQKQSMEDILDNFREKWKKELQISKQQQEIPVNSGQNIKDDTENTAKILFLNGVELERSGQLYEAIQYYRRAVQLVPDIEFRLDSKVKVPSKKNHTTEDNTDSDNTSETNEDDNRNISDSDSFEDKNDIKEGELLLYVQRKLNKDHSLFKPQIEMKGTHISALPMEIILYILRWVVSSDLDVRSLEICAQTCRGFYTCCRDSEIWRSICARTWGINLGSVPNEFNSWRKMFVDRARLHFNGCYISKTSYIRHGENSFQDQFYRPWHIVTYYRYLRFFPDGLVLMLTTADEPAQCVGLLRYRTTKSSAILSGHYILNDDKVTLIVHRHDSPKTNAIYKRNRKRDVFQDNSQQRFHLEMQIQNYKNQKHVQLAWIGYSIHTQNRNGTESICTFEIAGNRFPPLWFSRVKSYTAESSSPLH